MVIPLPAGSMGPQMSGPPPPQLESKFKWLRTFLAVELLGGFGILFTRILLGDAGNAIVQFLSCFLNCVFGIWLLADDPKVGQLHQCLVRVFCQGCADQCRGGLQCLLPFCLVNVIAFVVQLIGGDFAACFRAFSNVFSAAQVQLAQMVILLNGVSYLAVFVAEIGNAVLGCQAYSAAQQIASGVTAQDGTWGPSGGAGLQENKMALREKHAQLLGSSLSMAPATG
eukprot:CAMPEP_0178410302 /NCGR_PEP_ID=MMETSP0689_2-20121128/20909_1 /TAXON_ID=160604 /ORGANISM="Amphidinium massartii, Strain CS-259" /LENGTH=225 /DNA_ID=CAMNT_0020031473 /DNA_START=88 /DNA_END=766 /DNA_ORIENTATION=+